MRLASCWRYKPSTPIGSALCPKSLCDSPTAQALDAIVELDLLTLAEIEPPRGYGRD